MPPHGNGELLLAEVKVDSREPVTRPTPEQHCFCPWALRAGAEGRTRGGTGSGPSDPWARGQAPCTGHCPRWQARLESDAHRQNIVWRARGKGQCRASPTLCPKGLRCQCFPEETFSLGGGEESG